MEEFKDSKVWLKVDSNGNYDLNLAANEYMANGHTLDKHVGKTDEQLAQRLRDQQSGGPTASWPHGKPMPSGETSGRSVSKQPVGPNDPLSGYKQGGLNAKAYDVSGVDTHIRYDSSRNPPFTVMTSMPSKS